MTFVIIKCDGCGVELHGEHKLENPRGWAPKMGWLCDPSYFNRMGEDWCPTCVAAGRHLDPSGKGPLGEPGTPNKIGTRVDVILPSGRTVVASFSELPRVGELHIGYLVESVTRLDRHPIPKYVMKLVDPK